MGRLLRTKSPFECPQNPSSVACCWKANTRGTSIGGKRKVALFRKLAIWKDGAPMSKERLPSPRSSRGLKGEAQRSGKGWCAGDSILDTDSSTLAGIREGCFPAWSSLIFWEPGSLFPQGQCSVDMSSYNWSSYKLGDTV